jgi:ketosteroid isomerase-like protein
MQELTKDAINEIEQIHSNWIELEVAGENQSLMALCADDIELRAPDAQPLLGRAAVSAQMAQGTVPVQSPQLPQPAGYGDQYTVDRRNKRT